VQRLIYQAYISVRSEFVDFYDAFIFEERGFIYLFITLVLGLVVVD